jgi:hypothetical protein
VAPDVKHALPDPTPRPTPTALPEPEAAAPTFIEAEKPRRLRRDRSVGRAERARSSGYRIRFVLTYFGLAIVAGAAIGALVVVLNRPHHKAPPAWSKQFVPKGSLTARLFQIADQIPKGYRRENGKQLVGAVVTGPQQQISPDNQNFITIPLARIEVHEHGDIRTASAGSSIQFVLCGDGAGCEIGSGKPSTQRYLLLQREALELALYSLEYVGDLDSVTVLFPPSASVGADGNPTGQAHQTALFLERQDVASELSRPIDKTLASRPPRIGTMSKRDRQSVQTIAGPHTYDWTVAQAPDGAFVRMLQPAGS